MENLKQELNKRLFGRRNFDNFLFAKKNISKLDKRTNIYKELYALLKRNEPLNLYTVYSVPSTQGKREGFVLTTLERPHRHASCSILPIF